MPISSRFSAFTQFFHARVRVPLDSTAVSAAYCHQMFLPVFPAGGMFRL